MITMGKDFDQDPLDFYNETAAERIGLRIRKIRNTKGLSQAELGAAVGLSADRIQKYENGFRKPKADMLKKIAGALGVRALALIDPDTTSYVGAMFALFEMEEIFDLHIEEGPDNKPPSMCVTVDFRNNMYTNLKEWLEVYKKYKAQMEVAVSDEERNEILKSYRNWKWNYPRGLVEEQEAERAKRRLKKKIEELQEAYDKLS